MLQLLLNPEAVNQPGTNEHFDNLADLLPDEVLGRLGSDLYENYMQYKASRKDWEDGYTKGLDLLGFKYETRSQPFTNASGATHPVLAEAVTQFQASRLQRITSSDWSSTYSDYGYSYKTKRRTVDKSKKFHELSTHECDERV